MSLPVAPSPALPGGSYGSPLASPPRGQLRLCPRQPLPLPRPLRPGDARLRRLPSGVLSPLQPSWGHCSRAALSRPSAAPANFDSLDFSDANQTPTHCVPGSLGDAQQVGWEPLSPAPPSPSSGAPCPAGAPSVQEGSTARCGVVAFSLTRSFLTPGLWCLLLSPDPTFVFADDAFPVGPAALD